LEPSQIGMADESVRMRPDEHHRANIGIAIGALDEIEQLGSIFAAEQPEIIANKSRNDHPFAEFFDLDAPLRVLSRHRCRPSSPPLVPPSG
jgi:hypothetical protein